MKCKDRSDFEIALRGNILTHEQFAERLHCSPRVFAKYLYGELYPPCSVIAKAVEEFNTHGLAFDHLNEYCPIAKLYMGKLKRKTLPQAVLIMQHRLQAVRELESEYVKIAIDGCSDTEWQHQADHLKEVISCLISLIASERK